MSEVVALPPLPRKDPFAKVERGIALVDGLFRPLKDRNTRAEPLFVVYEGERYRFEFRGHEALDILDESVLWAVVSECHKGQELPAGATGEVGRTLREGQQASGFAVNRSSLAVVTTDNALLELLGLSDTGGNHKTLQRSLKRLSGVTVWVEDKVSGDQGSMLLLSVAMRPKQRKVYLALHHALAEAVLGDAKSVRLSLRERNLLQADASKACHRWVAAWLSGTPTCARISISRLEKHVYGNELEEGAPAKRKRYLKLRAALEEIGKLPGWMVVPLGVRGNVTYAIYRPDAVVALDVAEGRAEPPKIPSEMVGWVRAAGVPFLERSEDLLGTTHLVGVRRPARKPVTPRRTKGRATAS
ncbi:replication protein C, IncQ-type [Muricoccus vinaceus]|uniref:Replication protein C, IncQ-type n=1 Tax=Muricoccus vinaceus TaxID=424704 RepID=A0ABV6IZS4_9PROT